MASGEEIKVELTALSDLRYQLLKAKEYLDKPVEEARQATKRELERLKEIRAQRQAEVSSCASNLSACRAALSSCLTCVEDENTRCPPCGPLETAVDQAETELEQAKEALKEAEAHIANFQSQTEQILNSLISQKEGAAAAIEDARQELNDRIMKTIQYLKGNDIALPPTPGQNPHGGEYRNARNRFYEEGTAGDYPNMATDLRGWMEQEVNRGGYYRSPGAWRGHRMPDGSFAGRTPRATYHVGHTIRNLNIPENFRWELAQDNQGRTGWRGRVNNY